jgi:hypothetical protein
VHAPCGILAQVTHLVNACPSPRAGVPLSWAGMKDESSIVRVVKTTTLERHPGFGVSLAPGPRRSRRVSAKDWGRGERDGARSTGALVESDRTAKGSRHRAVAYLGKLAAKEFGGWQKLRDPGRRRMPGVVKNYARKPKWRSKNEVGCVTWDNAATACSGGDACDCGQEVAAQSPHRKRGGLTSAAGFRPSGDCGRSCRRS